MVLHPALRGTIAGLAALLLLWLAWEGISGGITQWSDTVTSWQRVQSASQLVYGASAILAIVTAFRLRRLRKYADLSFVVGACAAGGLATVVWGGKSALVGVATGIAAALVAALIVWMLHVGVPDTSSASRI